MDSATEGQYFDSVLEEDSNVDVTMFSELNLSRPILRAIEASGYVSPTPVQAKVIPVALAGRDICASAVTGSAFIVQNSTPTTLFQVTLDSKIGFFGATAVSRQTLGAATAASTYGTNEQGMLQRVYEALRNYGLGT